MSSRKCLRFSQSFLFILFFIFFPIVIRADVYISEIAWMGTENSSTDEWIELHNAGNEAVSLDGWVLSILDKKDIVLSGDIASGGYYLIERTDDSTVSSVVADLVASFGTGISNTGETLVLKNNSGGEEDRVIAGNDWQSIGGDNTTKETAQKNNNSWVTAVATPRASSNNQSSPTASVASSNSSVVDDDGESSEIKFNPDDIVVKIFPKKKVFVVGETATFSSSVTGLPSRLAWSFGDGTSKEYNFFSSNTTTEHIFDFPGEYFVILEACRGDQTFSNSVKINILDNPLDISLVTGGTGRALKIKNNSSHDIDVSFWKINSANLSFSFPKNTIVLAKKSLTISEKVVGFEIDKNILLLAPNGRIFTSLTTDAESPKPSLGGKIEPNKARLVVDNGFESEGDTSDISDVESGVLDVRTGSKVLESSENNSFWLWLILLSAVIVIPVVFINIFNKKEDNKNIITIID